MVDGRDSDGEGEREGQGKQQRLFRLERMCIGQSEWPSSQSVQIINAGEGVEKREPSYTIYGNVN